MRYQENQLDQQAQADARLRWNRVAKPLFSLGKLETLIAQIAGIQETADVALSPRCVLVFCADHGVVAEGVTQSGQEVTAIVARSIAEGSANVNLMASVASADVFAVDMGMISRVKHPAMIERRIAPSTQNLAHQPAMTREQAERAIQAGIDLVGSLKAKGYRIVLTGEMGIGNTTASTAMACALLNASPDELTGRGAGLSDAGLVTKRQVIRRALALHQPDRSDPLDVLAKVGGFEIAGMVGAFLGGMTHRVPVVMDGVISAVAALTAARLCPACRAFMLPSHMSREPAMGCILRELQLSPIVQGDLALGEGTGALTLLPLLDMAYRVYTGIHTFDQLGMEAYLPQEGEP